MSLLAILPDCIVDAPLEVSFVYEGRQMTEDDNKSSLRALQIVDSKLFLIVC